MLGTRGRECRGTARSATGTSTERQQEWLVPGSSLGSVCKRCVRVDQCFPTGRRASQSPDKKWKRQGVVKI